MRTLLVSGLMWLAHAASAATSSEAIRVDLEGYAKESFLVRAGTKPGPAQYSVSFFVEDKNFRNRAVPQEAFLAIRERLAKAWKTAEAEALTAGCLRPFRVAWRKTGAKTPQVLNACADRFGRPSQRGLAQWYAAVSHLR